MREDIRMRIAVLNAVWQRYARTVQEHLDSATAEALNRDYLAAWEGLDACGIAEWMLEYDPDTLTFSLPTTEKLADNEMLTIPFAATEKRIARSRWFDDGPDTERIQRI